MDNLNLNNIIGCLSEQSLRNIISLNISGTSIMSESRVPIVVSIGWFKSLNILNVSRTEVTTSSLQIIVKDLSQLTYLDISRTKVEDISVLLDIKDRLKSLVMHRIETSSFDNVLSVIVQLHKLRYLDASDKPKIFSRMRNVDLLILPETLPDLIKIDLSGNPFGLNIDDAKQLVENHPNLEFCGFTSWVGNSEKELEELYKLSLCYPKITMLGDRGEELLYNTVTYCRDRASYLLNAFQSIFEATNYLETHKPELLAAVLAVMRIHARRMDLMLAGTAVIYNLTKSELCNRYPLELLNRAVRVSLTAMEKFPKNQQLYKNCLLTICSDHVLHETKFSCKQCCELVFHSLLQFDDTHMNRMGVAIISILAAEIATSDLRDIARDPNRIKCLLSYVAEKCLLQTDIRMTPTHEEEMECLHSDLEPITLPPQRRFVASSVPQYFSRMQVRRSGSPSFDATLRFTLSALWNLTDECPEACQRFVSNGGLFIFEKMLYRFRDQDIERRDHVYTKCLGLLNNVAEVEATGHYLMKDNLMNFFLKMLRHPSIQISYFAAGILAHLTCLPEQTWINKLDGFVTKESCIRQLGQAVCSWSQPHYEMVAYRSFKPFEALIFHQDSRLEIQLWAVWAINHITTRK
ncbi:zyg-11 B, partial [Cichlidogyrus casuarinus]